MNFLFNSTSLSILWRIVTGRGVDRNDQKQVNMDLAATAGLATTTSETIRFSFYDNFVFRNVYLRSSRICSLTSGSTASSSSLGSQSSGGEDEHDINMSINRGTTFFSSLQCFPSLRPFLRSTGQVVPGAVLGVRRGEGGTRKDVRRGADERLHGRLHKRVQKGQPGGGHG